MFGLSTRSSRPLLGCAACLLCGVAMALPATAQQPAAAQPTAEELLERMDENLTFEARRARIVMTVEGPRTRSFEMIVYSRGEEDAAIEYVSPPREAGTRMLKLGDDLWIYLPTVDRFQKITGQMMRQGMMGSDVSYEDIMASRELGERYDARVTGESVVDGRPCWTLEMTARDQTVTYSRRVTCVDKETYIPLSQELYAASGMLLKTWTMSDVQEFEGGRSFPRRMEVRDHVTEDSVTRLEFSDVEFGAEVPQGIFTLQWLEGE